MPQLKPVDWKTLVKIFELDGFTQDRNQGSHIVMTKPGIARPVVIPKYPEVGLDIIRSNMRTADMSRERFFRLKNKKH